MFEEVLVVWVGKEKEKEKAEVEESWGAGEERGKVEAKMKEGEGIRGGIEGNRIWPPRAPRSPYMHLRVLTLVFPSTTRVFCSQRTFAYSSTLLAKKSNHKHKMPP